jgi:peptide/nickel transport system permease protein
MLRYTFDRLLISVLVAFAVSVVSFALLRLSGDLAAVLAGADATPEQIAKTAALYGLDRPLVEQYWDWLTRALAGDLGRSLFTNEPVLELMLSRVGVTVTLAVLSLTLALVVSVPLGVAAAVHANSWIDRSALALVVFCKAIPTFWFALILIYYFGVKLRLLPISGSDGWAHFVLPTIALATGIMPQLMRVTRSGMLDVLEADYIRTAWAKGLPARTVFFKHALRNAILPVVSLSAVSLGFLLGGSVIVETIFALNGIGSLAIDAIRSSDFPVVQSILFFLSVSYILLTLTADLVNGKLDPRIRLG